MHFDFFLVIVGEAAVLTARRLLTEGSPWRRPAPAFGVFSPPGEPAHHASLALFAPNPQDAVVQGVRTLGRFLYVRGSSATLNTADTIFRSITSQCQPEEMGMGVVLDELSAESSPSHRVGFRSSEDSKSLSFARATPEAEWVCILAGQPVSASKPAEQCKLPTIVRLVASLLPAPRA